MNLSASLNKLKRFDKDTTVVAVLGGGLSSERDVSLSSAQGVLTALLNKGYQALLLDTKAPLSELTNALGTLNVSVVFNALHGKYGEDGCIQGVLNMMQIPYTHSGVLAQACAMNKTIAKRLVAQGGLDVAKGALVEKETLKGVIAFPYVVKPNDEGSSVGVYIIHNQEEEQNLLDKWPFQKPVLIEEFIEGRELSVAVLDEGALGSVEIVPNQGFYDYQTKYSDDMAQHIIPAPLPQEIQQRILSDAYKAHQILGCKGVSRTDFRYDEKTNRVVFLEINTNPGMTAFSLVPQIAQHQGISYEDLVELILQKAEFE